MRATRKIWFTAMVLIPLIVTGATTAMGDEKSTTTIHLTEHNGYFEVEETLMNLEPGDYAFQVNNTAGKMVGFLIQDLKTHEVLAMGPIEAGKKREYKVTVSENGFRFRCPINPTPWYEVSVGKM